MNYMEIKKKMYEESKREYASLNQKNKEFVKKLPSMFYYNGLLNTMIYLNNKTKEIYNLFSIRVGSIEDIAMYSSVKLMNKTEDALDYANWLKIQAKIKEKSEQGKTKEEK